MTTHPPTFTALASCSSYLAAADVVTDFNRRHNAGGPVLYWPLGFCGPARLARTRDVARVRKTETGQCCPEVYVDGCGAPVPLTFVALLDPQQLRGQLRLEVATTVTVDLDAPGGLLPTGDELLQALAPLKRALAQRHASERGAG